MNFGTLSPGQTSSTTSVSVYNANGSTVTLGTPSIAGTDPSDFAITANGCGSSLTSHNVCIITMDFAPVVEGALTATLSVSSTYGTGTETLNGTAVPATFSPATVTFPSTAIGQTSATETTTLTNNTSSALTISSTTVTAGYNITANTCTGTLAASPASCTVTMTFSPATAGTVAGTLSVVDNIGTQTAALTGVGLAATAAAATLPAEAVGASESATVTFTFGAATTLSSVSVLTQGLTGLDFTAGTQLGTACAAQSYNAGQACTVVVNFKPGAPGKRLGAVSLSNNASTPVVVATAYLQGTGTGADAVFYPGTGTTTIMTGFNGPTSPVIDAAGNIMLGDSNGVYYIPAGAAFRYVIVQSGGHATALDGAGNLYYAAGSSIYEIPSIETTYTNGVTPIQIATLPTDVDNSMMIDASGNLFVPTSGSGSGGGIYEVAAGTHAVTNVIAQGAATSDGGTLGRTIGTFMDAAGDMYLADFTNSKIDEVLAGSSTVTVVQGDDQYLNQPYAVAVDAAGDLFVTNYAGQPCTLKYALVSGSYNRSQYCGTIVGNYGVTLDINENLVLLNSGSITRYTRTATPALAFPTTAVGGTSSTQSTNLENEGNMPLTFTSVAASSANFSTAGTTCSTTSVLATGANCNVVAAFTPQTAGNLTGTANLLGNNLAATTETQTVALTGTANLNLGFTTPPPASLQTGQSAGTVVAALENSNGSVNTTAPATAITLTVMGPSGYTTATYSGTTATTGGGAGTVTFNLISALTITGGYTYTLSDANGDSSASVSENVYPYKLAISGVTTPQAASGTANSVTVAITDNSGNATSQTNAITLTVMGAGSYSQSYGPTAAGANGQVTFTAAGLTAAGMYTYTASSAASPDGTAVTGTSATQVITAAATSTFTVVPVSTTAYAGFADNITVSARDAYGNLATSYAGTVALTSTDPGPATLPANFTLSSGTATVPVIFRTVTSTGWTVTATDTANAALTQTSVAIVVQPVPVYTVTVNTDPTTGTASNCSNQALSGATLDANCELRDALAASNALNLTGTSNVQPTINFAASALSTGTITLGAALNPTANVNIAGPGAASLTLAPATTYHYDAFTSTTSSVAFTLSGVTVTQFGINGTTTGSPLYFAPSSASFADLITLSHDAFTNGGGTPGGNAGPIDGGAVYAAYSALVVTGSVFTGNTATQGGAIYALSCPSVTITGSTFGSQGAPNRSLTGGAGGGAILLSTNSPATISTSTFAYNTSANIGGAIDSSSAVTLNSDVFLNNAATTYGGAVYMSAAVTIAGSTFNNNTAKSYGGAIYQQTSLLTISGSSFTANQSGSGGTTEGGAIYDAYTVANGSISNTNFLSNRAVTTSGIAYGGALSVDRVNLTNVLFSGNYTSGTTNSYGGAAYYTGSSTSIFTGVTFTGNSTQTGSTGATTQEGGGLYQNASTLNLYNTTVTGNSSKTGGGIYKASGTLNLYNSVVSGDTATTSYQDVYSGVNITADSYYNIAAGATCSTYCTPLLSALGSYGGGTVGAPGYTTLVQTMIPLPGSPLLAAGSASYIAPNVTTNPPGTVTCNGVATEPDARGCGYSRSTSYNGVSHVDIGAAEANYTLGFVTQPANTAVNAALLPPPTVQIFESGVAFGGTGGTLAVAAESGSLYTTSADSTAFTGVATTANGLESVAPYFSMPQSDDALIVSVKSGGATPVTVASTMSEPFSITNTSAASITFSTPPPASVDGGGNAGMVTIALTNSGGATNTTATAAVTLTVSGPGSYSQTYGPAAAVNGMVSFNLSGVALTTAGNYTYAATASAYTTDTATAPETVGGEGVWVVDASGTLVKLTTTGALSTTVANASGSSASFGGVAFDFAGDVFSVNSGANTLAFATYGGSSVATYTGGGLSMPSSVAVDGAGYVWISNMGTNTVSEFTDARTAISPATGYGTAAGLSAPSAVVLDSAGSVWVTNKAGNSVTHIFGAATPVVTPLASGTENGTLGAKP